MIEDQRVTNAGSEGAESGSKEVIPTFSEQLASQLGGARGLIESGIPILLFVIANLIWPKDLKIPIAISVGFAVALAIWRLAKHRPIRHALNGVFGVAIGAIIALKTGSAKNFYLPGILLSLTYGLAMIVSVIVRRPVIGWAWAVVADGGATTWRENPKTVRLFNRLTLVWAVTYLVKTGIQAALFTHTAKTDPATALGIARLALGYPPYLGLLALTVWAVRRHRQSLAAEV